MKKIDLYYGALLKLLRHIATSDSSMYYNALGNDEKELFENKVNALTDNLFEIQRSKNKGDTFNDFENLSNEIDSFGASFPDFPNARIDRIKAVVSICKRVGAKVNEQDINPDNFTLIELPSVIKPTNYFFSGSSVKESILLFNLKKPLAFDSYINLLPEVHINILFYLLAKLNTTAALAGSQYILVSNKYKDSKEKLISLLQLCAVCDGECIHDPIKTPRKPVAIDRSNIKLSNSYQQFNDTIDIFSEYNYEKDVLNKYLRLYHVVENFMYRVPIVDLTSSTGGKMFSVRHFKSLYAKVELKENIALDDLFEVLFKKNIQSAPAATFKQYVWSQWQRLSGLPSFDMMAINSLLKAMNIASKSGFYTYTSINANNVLPFYSKIVYQFRNSIVHNKETEHHILHSTMDSIIPFILEEFLFPSLETICLQLVVNVDPVITYSHSRFELYS